MSKKLTIFVLILLTLMPLFKTTKVEVRADDALNTPPNQEIVAKKLDKEAQILQKYLAKFDSPLQYHAQDFIDAAKIYHLDWKMLPAIAGVESTFGKQIPGGFNAYGWGVYGDQAIYFNSWTEGIYAVAKGLRENYLDKGYQEPDAINRIYAASPYWGGKVTYFMNDLENFAKSLPESAYQIGEAPSIAAASGQIAFSN